MYTVAGGGRQGSREPKTAQCGAVLLNANVWDLRLFSVRFFAAGPKVDPRVKCIMSLFKHSSSVLNLQNQWFFAPSCCKLALKLSNFGRLRRHRPLPNFNERKARYCLRHEKPHGWYYEVVRIHDCPACSVITCTKSYYRVGHDW